MATKTFNNRKKHTRSRRPQKNNSSLWLIAIGALILVLGGIIIVFSGQGSTGTTDPSSVKNLLPLTKPVNPIEGWHDMENMIDPNQPKDSLPADAPQPNVTIPVSYFDFGTVPAAPDNAVQTFPIENTGTEPLIIERMVTSCACTTAQLTSSVIEPGKRADLTVVFDPDFHDTEGPVKRIVWMQTNDPDMPVAEVSITANVQK